MQKQSNRREFLVKTGISAAAANLMMGLPSLTFGADEKPQRKQRLVFVFSPNGVIPKHFWPDDPANAQATNRVKKHM